VVAVVATSVGAAGARADAPRTLPVAAPRAVTLSSSGPPAPGPLASAPAVGEGPIVCVVDTGVREAAGVAGRVVSRSVLTDDPATDDPASAHGTEVARAVLQTWPQARIASVRVVESQGVDPRRYAPAVDACVAAGASVVNLSLAGPVFDDAKITGELRAAVTRARAAGRDVVVAAGNTAGPLEYPAAVLTDLAVVVDATDGSAKRCSFASTGDGVTVGAAGCPLWLPSDAPGSYLPVSGSSVAAPQVAATLAALQAYAPGLGVAGRRAALSGLPGMTLDQAEVLRRAGRADLVPVPAAVATPAPAAAVAKASSTARAARPRVTVAWSRTRTRVTVLGAPAKLRVTVSGNGRRVVARRTSVAVPPRLLRRRGALTVLVTDAKGKHLKVRRVRVPARVVG
jgi:hypothetical protein